jgi:hypothetical protein
MRPNVVGEGYERSCSSAVVRHVGISVGDKVGPSCLTITTREIREREGVSVHVRELVFREERVCISCIKGHGDAPLPQTPAKFDSNRYATSHALRYVPILPDPSPFACGSLVKLQNAVQNATQKNRFDASAAVVACALNEG